MVKIVDLSEVNKKKIEKEKELTDIIVEELPIKVKVINSKDYSIIEPLGKEQQPIISSQIPFIHLFDEKFFDAVKRAAEKYEKKTNIEITLYKDYSIE